MEIINIALQFWYIFMIFRPTFKVRNRRYSFYIVKFDADKLIDIFNCDGDLFYRLNLININKRYFVTGKYYFLGRICFHNYCKKAIYWCGFNEYKFRK